MRREKKETSKRPKLPDLDQVHIKRTQNLKYLKIGIQTFHE